MPAPKKSARISIQGPIGSFAVVDAAGKTITYNGLQSKDVISQITRLDPSINHLDVEVGGLGGEITAAKSIRRYLKSIQSRYSMTAYQVDDLASAHTIVFTSIADRRVPQPGAINPNTGAPYENMVHNPWVTHMSGDADKLEAGAEDLRADEEEFLAMYVEDGMDGDAMRPLMKDSATFNSQEAKDLKFATGFYTASTKAAYKTTNTMATEKKKPAKGATLLQQLAAALGIQTSGNEVAAAPPADLMGKAVMINGQPAVDGVYTVVGGVITLLASVPGEEQAAAAPAGGAAASAQPANALAAMTKEELIEAITVAVGKPAKVKKKAEDPEEEEEEEETAGELSKKDQKLITTIVSAVTQINTAQKGAQRVGHVPPGFKPENKVALVAEWDRSFKANEHTAMRREDPEKYARLFYAKYGRIPN